MNKKILLILGAVAAAAVFAFVFAKRGETLDCVPSRFLEELPQDEVEWEKRDGNVSADERRQRGRAAIADLRSLLGEG
jgi:hypothetical protein